MNCVNWEEVQKGAFKIRNHCYGGAILFPLCGAGLSVKLWTVDDLRTNAEILRVSPE